jgi:hypothetical protein
MNKGINIQDIINNIPYLIRNMIFLIINPKKILEETKEKKWTYLDAIVYLKIAALPAFIGLVIGHYYYWQAQLGGSFMIAILLYVATFIGVIIGGLLLNVLAPMANIKQQPMQMVKLFSYTATPFLLLGILLAYPTWLLAIFGILAALFGWYIFYLGIPIFFNVTKETHMKFFFVGIIIFIIGWIILWWGVWIGLDTILGGILWPYEPMMY